MIIDGKWSQGDIGRMLAYDSVSNKSINNKAKEMHIVAYSILKEADNIFGFKFPEDLKKETQVAAELKTYLDQKKDRPSHFHTLVQERKSLNYLRLQAYIPCHVVSIPVPTLTPNRYWPRCNTNSFFVSDLEPSNWFLLKEEGPGVA